VRASAKNRRHGNYTVSEAFRLASAMHRNSWNTPETRTTLKQSGTTKELAL